MYEVSQNLTKQVVMMQSYAWMILDELDESNEKLWVFKGEFLMIFLLKYFLSEKYDIWNS